MRLSKAEKEKRKALKELEEMAQKIKKKNWAGYKGTAIYKEEFKEKRKPKKISDVTKGINVLDRKLDKLLKENIKLKEEIIDIKKKQKEHKLQKVKEDKPKGIMQLVRDGGGKIDPIAYAENAKLIEKLNKKKETK